MQSSKTIGSHTLKPYPSPSLSPHSLPRVPSAAAPTQACALPAAFPGVLRRRRLPSPMRARAAGGLPRRTRRRCRPPLEHPAAVTRRRRPSPARPPSPPASLERPAATRRGHAPPLAFPGAPAGGSLPLRAPPPRAVAALHRPAQANPPVAPPPLTRPVGRRCRRLSRGQSAARATGGGEDASKKLSRFNIFQILFNIFEILVQRFENVDSIFLNASSTNFSSKMLNELLIGP